MSDFNSSHNRLVWFDLPVIDLDRASAFYRAVLGVGVEIQQFGDQRFAVIEHREGNGGCLVLGKPASDPNAGVLVYFNAEGRLQVAVKAVQSHGGRVLEPVTPIGPHGFRAVVLDTEGNRVALHSSVDG